MLFAYAFSFKSLDVIGPSTDVIVHDLWYRCYCTYTYVVFMIHFFFNSGMENRILSQICGRLYFPIFLFRVGLFTLMYIDSLMVLARLFSSLPIILKLFRLFHGHYCSDAGILVKELSNVLCISLQKFFQTPLYTLHHSQSLHMYNCISHCFYL